MDEDMKLLARADPAFQESLQSEVEPDPMEGEQTWPTDEELKEAEGDSKQSITIFDPTCFQSLIHSRQSNPGHLCNRDVYQYTTGHLRGFIVKRIELLCFNRGIYLLENELKPN